LISVMSSMTLIAIHLLEAGALRLVASSAHALTLPAGLEEVAARGKPQ
jgi:hypothetical protein